MATPTYATALSQINTFIVANGNNEITANVLNPVLKVILDFANNNIGDLNALTTDETNTIVESINSLKQNFEDLINNGVQLHTGYDDPNVTPPADYNYGDFYMQLDSGDDSPIKLWQWNGFEWKDSSNNPATNSDNVENNSDVVGQNVTEALNNLLNSLPNEYTKVVYVNNNNPNSATIFDLNNPPTVNDNLLKSDVNNLYIGLDASTWVYNATSLNYVTKTISSNTSNFYIEGTTTDAGNSKTAAITRSGIVNLTNQLKLANGTLAKPSILFPNESASDTGINHQNDGEIQIITQGVASTYINGTGVFSNNFTKTGGLGTQYLMANGTTTTLTNPVTGTGVSGRVSFWNGTDSQTSDSNFVWDNVNKRLGIGTTPIFRLDVKDTNGGTFFDGGNTTYNRWKSYGTTAATGKPLLISAQVSGTTPDIYIHSSGGVSIGNTTDLGTGTLNVTGNITAPAGTTASHVVIKSQLDLKANLAGTQTFTGIHNFPTPAPGTNTTQVATTAFVQEAVSSGSYTPTVTLGTNVTATTTNACKYTAIGKVITVSFNIYATVTTPSNPFDFTITLPFTKSGSDSYVSFSGSSFGASGPVIGSAHGQGESTTTAKIRVRNTTSTNTTIMVSGILVYTAQ